MKDIDTMRSEFKRINKIFQLESEHRELEFEIITLKDKIDSLPHSERHNSDSAKFLEQINELTRQSTRLTEELRPLQIDEAQSKIDSLQNHLTSSFLTKKYHQHQNLYKKLRVEPNVARVLQQRQCILKNYKQLLEQYIDLLKRKSTEDSVISNIQSKLDEQSQFLDETEIQLLKAIIKVKGKTIPPCSEKLLALKMQREKTDQLFNHISESTDEQQFIQAIDQIYANSELYYDLEQEYQQQLENLAFNDSKAEQLKKGLFLIILLALGYLIYSEIFV